MLIAGVHFTPTYTVSGPAGVNEGSNVTFTITTTNAMDATYNWDFAGITYNGVDPYDVTPFSGTVTTVSGTANVSVFVFSDQITEGVEFMTFRLRSSYLGPILASYQVTVNDTSTATPVGNCYRYTILNETGIPDLIEHTACNGTNVTTFTLFGGQSRETACTNLDDVTLPDGWTIVSQTACNPLA